MISLERVLDGLEVVVEPLQVRDVRAGVLALAGGATVRFSSHRVIIAPPQPTTPVVVAGPSDPDLLVGSERIRVSYQGSINLFDHLREPLVVNLAADDPLRRAFEDLMDEIARPQPGSRGMAEALLRRCLILVLRRCCQGRGHWPSWLAALEDARLARVVATMQNRPEHTFTLAELAEMAGMSRSVFAARFTAALGQSPMDFLRTLRLGRAAQLLTRTDLPVKTVASRVGYSSRSSFTRAFVARNALGPTAFRATTGDSTTGLPTAHSHLPGTEVA